MKQITSKFLKFTILVVLGTMTGFAGGCQTTSATKHSLSDADTAPLHLVVQEAEAAINDYQRSAGSTNPLPPLKTAEFDFKTTTAVIGGGEVDFYIFKLGASGEKDTAQDVTFTYQVPSANKGAREFTLARPTFRQELTRAITAAATAAKASSKMGGLPFSQLKVQIQYGAKWDGKAGVGVPIQLVTVGVNIDTNRNSVQTVTLTFAAS